MYPEGKEDIITEVSGVSVLDIIYVATQFFEALETAVLILQV